MSHQPPPGPTPPSASSTPPDWEALARYLAGESAPDEAEQMAAWLAAHPDDARLFGVLDDAVTRLAPPALTGAVDVEAALARTIARRDREDAAERGGTMAGVLPLRRRSSPQGAPVVVPMRRPARRWLAGGVAAAAAVAALVVGVASWPDNGGDGATPARSYATPVGTRDSVRLPDGSRVVLAPGSTLQVAAGYGDGARQVTLTGAAWFAVRHDAARPFTVQAGDALVRDLGTEFSVRTDGVDDGRGVAVSVTEGIVSLAAARTVTGAPPPDTGVVLAAGDRGVLGADGRARAERGAATEADVAWTRGRLVYDGAPLAVVRADVRRWYGVELQVADSALTTRRLTARFDGEPVERVLDVIALAIGATVERTGNRAVLRASGRSPVVPPTR